MMDHPDAGKLSAEALHDPLRRVVRAVLEYGLSRTQAEVFGVSRASVIDWVRACQEGGEAALEPALPGPVKGRGASLTARQGEQARAWIVDSLPDEPGLGHALWTREAVGQLLEDRFGVVVTRTTVGRYPASWGLTPQKHPENVESYFEHSEGAYASPNASLSYPWAE